MSKVFVPQFSSPAGPSREFVNQEIPPDQDHPPIFPAEWPHFEFRENGLKWNQAMKEKEEKALKQAREKALLIEKEAYEKGFAQGEKDGLELSQKRFETVLDSFRQLLEEMNRLHRELYKKYEGEMVQLIFAITRKILRHEVLLPEEVVKETLRAAFQYVIEPREIVVHLNPKDHHHLLTHPEGLPWGGKDQEVNSIKIVADPSVTRGGCFLETSFGDIDATLEGQLEQILSLARPKPAPPTSLPDRSDP